MKTTSLSLYIALRLYRNSKQNKIISFISNVSILGNSLSIAILITCLSAINGFKNELHERIFSIIPHGNIQSINSKFDNWVSIKKNIQKIPGIIQTIPYINFSGLIIKKNKFYPIQIHGINSLYNVHPNITNYLSSIDTTQYFYPNKQIIILGKGAADTLNIQKNDWITILIHNANLNKKFFSHKKINVQVIDILNLNNYLDHNLALMPLLDAQTQTNKIGDISGINIKINNISHINQLLNQIQKIINNNKIIVQNWTHIYKYIYQDMHIIKMIIYITMTLIVCIACFGIVSILTLIIKEKKHDLAIFHTLGSKNYLIYAIFIWYGSLNTLTSITIGGTIGILLSLYLTKICSTIENIFKYKILSNDSYFINFLPTELHIQDVIVVFSINVCLSLLAILYPIIRANHTNPATILK